MSWDVALFVKNARFLFVPLQVYGKSSYNKRGSGILPGAHTINKIERGIVSTEDFEGTKEIGSTKGGGMV